jgi:hypothetical protein
MKTLVRSFRTMIVAAAAVLVIVSDATATLSVTCVFCSGAGTATALPSGYYEYTWAPFPGYASPPTTNVNWTYIFSCTGQFGAVIARAYNSSHVEQDSGGAFCAF